MSLKIERIIPISFCYVMNCCFSEKKESNDDYYHEY